MGWSRRLAKKMSGARPTPPPASRTWPGVVVKDAFAQGPFDAQCVTAAQALHFFCALADQAVNDGDMTRFGIGIHDDAKRPAPKGLSPIAMGIDKLAGLRFPGNLRCMEYHFPYFRNNGFY